MNDRKHNKANIIGDIIPSVKRSSYACLIAHPIINNVSIPIIRLASLNQHSDFSALPIEVLNTTTKPKNMR